MKKKKLINFRVGFNLKWLFVFYLLFVFVSWGKFNFFNGVEPVHALLCASDLLQGDESKRGGSKTKRPFLV